MGAPTVKGDQFYLGALSSPMPVLGNVNADEVFGSKLYKSPVPNVESLAYPLDSSKQIILLTSDGKIHSVAVNTTDVNGSKLIKTYTLDGTRVLGLAPGNRYVAILTEGGHLYLLKSLSSGYEASPSVSLALKTKAKPVRLQGGNYMFAVGFEDGSAETYSVDLATSVLEGPSLKKYDGILIWPGGALINPLTMKNQL
jgi:hypothetical protein